MHPDLTQTLLLTAGLSVLGTVVVYLGIAFASLLLGTPAAVPPVSPLDLTEFRRLAVDLPPEETLLARDGTALRYRRYPSPGAPLTLLLLHGSGGQSSYLAALGRALSGAGVAEVVTPDLRGHGHSGGRSGDVSHAGQLEEDVRDFLGDLRSRSPGRRVVLGGHSLGGGLALTVAARPGDGGLAGLVLLAPFLAHDAPTTRPGSGGWASPNLGRMTGLTMLDAVGLHALEDLEVLRFNIPPERREGATPVYSFRMYRSLAPRAWREAVAALRVPTLVLVGTGDAIFDARRYPAAFAAQPRARVEVLEGMDHLGVAWRPEALAALGGFLGGLSPVAPEAAPEAAPAAGAAPFPADAPLAALGSGPGR